MSNVADSESLSLEVWFWCLATLSVSTGLLELYSLSEWLILAFHHIPWNLSLRTPPLEQLKQRLTISLGMLRKIPVLGVRLSRRKE